MRVAITGSTGLVGRELTRVLRAAGHSVTQVVRSYSSVPQGERAVVWHPSEARIEAAGLERHDAVIHLAGESIAGVWTGGKRRRILESRVNGTRLLVDTLLALDSPPRTLISASAVGIYGDRGETPVDETTPAGEGFLADVGRAWEAEARRFEAGGGRVVTTRFGNVLSPQGGMLDVLLPLFKLGLAARMGSGRQRWPWIALEDVGGAMLHVLGQEGIHGPVNFVAPEVPTNAEFTDTLAAVVGRPSVLAVPKFAARLAPGGMADEMLLGGALVKPRVLLETGYAFRWPHLKPALMSMLRR